MHQHDGTVVRISGAGRRPLLLLLTETIRLELHCMLVVTFCGLLLEAATGTQSTQGCHLANGFNWKC